MDEKTMAVAGAAAGLALTGRGLRPVAKLMMRGVVAVGDGTASAREDLAQLYAEAKAEQRGEAAAQPANAAGAGEEDNGT